MARGIIIIECGLTSGLGRVRRSLTLAAALRNQGLEIIVVLSSAQGQQLVEDLGFEASLQLPDDISKDLVIIDTCSDTAEQVGEICRAAHYSLVIDDLAERPVACDYLVNPNLYADGLDYSAYTIGHAFLGPDYTLVDQRFFAFAKPARERCGTVVSFGGTDGGTLAVPVLKELLQASNEPIWVPIPGYVEVDSALDAMAQAENTIEIVRNADMPALLGKSRAFIGAAGATTLEALASGCAVSVVATQDDQHINAAYLAAKGVPSASSFEPAAMVRGALAGGRKSKELISAQISIEAKAVGQIADLLSSRVLVTG